MGLLKASGVLPGLVAANWKGPPETLQTHSVRMNLRPGSLPRFLVCHSCSCGFLDFWPTIGFFTTASLKWSTTAAMAKTPPSRSYRLFSGMACLACACALSAAPIPSPGRRPARRLDHSSSGERGRNVNDMATSLARTTERDERRMR